MEFTRSRLVTTIATALLLGACGGGGGGGGGGGEADSSTPTTPSSSSTSSSSAAPIDGTHFVDEQVGFSTLNGGTTGGAGGAVVTVTTGTELNAALCNRATKTTPIIILVNGTINHGNTTKQSGQCDTQPDVIELKGIENISIIGVGSNAVFDQIGIHIRAAKNIIIRNVHVKNVKKSGSPTSNGGDAIGMESDVSNVWVDHVTLEASGGESAGYDALFDMKDGTKHVTLSWSHLKNSGRGGLVGSGDSDCANGPITYHHNYYENLDSRTHLLRCVTAHIFNNYYNGLNESGINSRVGSLIKVENNYFTNARNPLGTFYTSLTGYWEVAGNIFGSGVTWVADVKNEESPAGPDVKSTVSAPIAIPYAYALDDAANIPDIVKNGAGAGKMPASLLPGGGGSSSSASSSSSSSSSAGSSSSNSSSSASSVAAGVTGSWTEDFMGATATNFFSAAYKALPDDANAAMYVKTGGAPSFSDGVMTLTGARITIGARGNAGTTASSTPGGIFTINSLSCTLSLNMAEAGSGTGKFQVYVDNNTTSGGNSVHGSASKVVEVVASTITSGANSWDFALNTAGFTGGSFLMLRTESSATVKVDSASLSCN